MPITQDTDARIRALTVSVESALGRQPTPIEIEPFRSGVDCFVDRIKIGGQPAVIRSARHEILKTSYEGEVDFGYIVEKDARVIELLTDASIPTPRLLSWHRSGGGLDVSWMITSLVDHETVEELDSSAQESLGAIARRIHAIEPAASAISDLNFDDLWDESICQRIVRRVNAARRYMDIPPTANLESAIRGAVAGRSEFARSLLHLDLRAPNVAVDRNSNVTCVFDFSNAIVGDPLLELARVRGCGLLSVDFAKGYGYNGRMTAPEARAFLAYGLDIHALLVVVSVEELDDPELHTRSIFETTQTLLQLV